MLNRSLIAIVVSTAAPLSAPVIAHAQGAQTVDTTANAIAPPTKTGHVEVNGVNYYYEIRGKGEPLLLLHGGLGSIDMFGPLLPTLAETRAGDRGRPAGPRPHRPRRPADQPDRHGRRHGARSSSSSATAQVDVLGYSLGGGVALPVRRAASRSGAPARAASRRRSRRTASIRRCCRSRRRSARRCADDEGHADVQVVRRGRAEPGGLSEAARRDGRVHAHSRTTGRETSRS